MKKFIRIGVDLGKTYFQIHALECEDGGATTRKLGRQAMRKLFSERRSCPVGMEACGSAHYWARELQAMGHALRLIPPIHVKPYVKRGKNDPADAAAICEAATPVRKPTSFLRRRRELLAADRQSAAANQA